MRTELALKLFMTAEKFKGILHDIYLARWPIYTAIQGIKVLFCAEKLGGGTKRFRYNLLQSTLVWTPDDWAPKHCCILDCQLDGREATQPFNFTDASVIADKQHSATLVGY
jgi:hypothetical protein